VLRGIENHLHGPFNVPSRRARLFWRQPHASRNRRGVFAAKMRRLAGIFAAGPERPFAADRSKTRVLYALASSVQLGIRTRWGAARSSG
jgi:hypothetical protein